MLKLLYLSLFAPFFAYSQIEIRGTVKDSLNTPIEFANVFLTNQSNDIVTGTITDQRGDFNLPVKKGSYTLTISFMGYEDWTQEVTLNENKDFGNIILSKSKNKLNEVVITASKPLVERKVDRLVFNVENSISATGGDALDALKISPIVRVQNNQISMIGKSNMKVMIDGRLTQLSGDDLVNFLKSIPIEDIKSIEIITNPPSKYEAEGNSGLINIVYRKGRRNSWSSTVKASYIQTTFPAYSLGGNFSYYKNKIKFLANISGKIGDEAVIEKSKVFYPTQTWEGTTNRKDKQDYISGRITIDYLINNKSTIGIQYIGGVKNPDIKDKNETKVFDMTNSLDSLIISNGFNNATSNNYSVNLHYVLKDTIGANVSLDLDYFNFDSSQDRNFDSKNYFSSGLPTSTFLSAINTSSQNIDNYSAKIDIEHPLKWIDLSYGAKASFINNDNGINFFDTSTGTPVINFNQSDRFTYEENTQSIYINGSKNIGAKWQTQLGFRLENTQTNGISAVLNQTNKNNYTKLFPSFYLTYLMNENNSFSFNYGRRIERPSYWQLNPFRWYFNSISYSEGNPFLQPSFTNNYEFSHSYKKSLVSNLFFSHTTDGFNTIPFVDVGTNQQIFTQKNYYTEYKYGISESYMFKKYKWWYSYKQAYIYLSNSDFDKNVINIPEQEGTGFYFSTFNTFFFNESKSIRGEINFWYNSKNKSLLYELDKAYNLSFGMKFLLFDKNLQISLSANDVLKTSSPNGTTKTNNIKQIYNSYQDNK